MRFNEGDNLSTHKTHSKQRNKFPGFSDHHVCLNLLIVHSSLSFIFTSHLHSYSNSSIFDIIHVFYTKNAEIFLLLGWNRVTQCRYFCSQNICVWNILKIFENVVSSWCECETAAAGRATLLLLIVRCHLSPVTGAGGDSAGWTRTTSSTLINPVPCSELCVKTCLILIMIMWGLKSAG